MTDEVPVATQFQWKSTSWVFGDIDGKVLCSISPKVLELVAVSVHIEHHDGSRDPCDRVALGMCGEIKMHLDNSGFDSESQSGSLVDRVKDLVGVVNLAKDGKVKMWTTLGEGASAKCEGWVSVVPGIGDCLKLSDDEYYCVVRRIWNGFKQVVLVVEVVE